MDILKIDGSFVKGVLHDPIDREMVRSINEVLRGRGVDFARAVGPVQ